MTKQIPQGYKQTKLGVIPEDWEVVKLNEKSVIQRGRFSPRPRNDPQYYNGNYPFVQTNDVVNSKGKITNYSQTLNEKGLKVSKIFPKGTILMTIAANIGFTGILTIDMTCPDSLVGIKCKKDLYNKYLNFYFMFNQKRIDYLAEEAAQKNINLSTLNVLNIPFPPLKEQEKIAEILSTWDDVITKQEQLIEQKQVFKKGIMQQIFSQSLRFTDDNGNDYQAWETKKLGDVVNHFGGTSLEQYVDASGKYKFISIGNYSTTGHYIDNLQRINANDKSMSKILNANDLVMVLNDKTSTGDIIGSTILINEDNKFIYNQRSERLVCQHIAFPKFLWFYLNSTEFRSMVFSIAQGGTQIYINFPAVKKLTLNLPSLQEQAKIADFLTSIDDEIIKQTQILEQLKLQKQSLVQKLLTGQVRV